MVEIWTCQACSHDCLHVSKYKIYFTVYTPDSGAVGGAASQAGLAALCRPPPAQHPQDARPARLQGPGRHHGAGPQITNKMI